jgi:hypothetical protein
LSAESLRHQQRHRIYPYLLRNVVIERPNQVWAADITYIPISRSFPYLVAMMDWASRGLSGNLHFVDFGAGKRSVLSPCRYSRGGFITNCYICCG